MLQRSCGLHESRHSAGMDQEACPWCQGQCRMPQADRSAWLWVRWRQHVWPREKMHQVHVFTRRLSMMLYLYCITSFYSYSMYIVGCNCFDGDNSMCDAGEKCKGCKCIPSSKLCFYHFIYLPLKISDQSNCLICNFTHSLGHSKFMIHISPTVNVKLNEF